MNEHSSKQFDAELDVLRANLTRMGGMVEEQLRAALAAFEGADSERLEAIVASDEGIDRMELVIDDACAQIVARRQPTAIDLRLVMAIGKAVTDLERIGDEAKSIAKVKRKLDEQGAQPTLPQAVGIVQLGEQTAAMLNEVLDAFVRSDAAEAARIIRQDKEIDRQFRAIVRQLVTYMMEDARTISTALDIIFVAKSIERVGDHCKNIAEDVIFIARGRDVRHLSLEALEREARGE